MNKLMIEENINQWIFDYLEQKLDKHDLEMFENYLLANPNVNEEVEIWKLTYLKKSANVSYDLDKILIRESPSKGGKWRIGISIFSILFILFARSFFFFSANQNNYVNDASHPQTVPTKSTPHVLHGFKANAKIISTKIAIKQEPTIGSSTPINSFHSTILLTETKQKTNTKQKTSSESSNASTHDQPLSVPLETVNEAIEKSLTQIHSKGNAPAPLQEESTQNKDILNDNLQPNKVSKHPTKTDSAAHNKNYSSTEEKNINAIEAQNEQNKKHKKHSKNKAQNFDLHPDHNFIESNDNF